MGTGAIIRMLENQFPDKLESPLNSKFDACALDITGRVQPF